MRLAVLGPPLALLVACGDPLPPLPIDAGALADAAPSEAGGPRYAVPMAVGMLPPSGLPELSGLVASRTHPDILWALNDSGNPAELYAIDTRGALRATYAIAGATNVDWEDLALADGMGGAQLLIADVGDNLARESDGARGRSDIQLYRVAEPDPAAGDATLVAERFDLVYPDRPWDCEAVFVDPRTGDVHFVTKSGSPAPVYVARAPLDPGMRTPLEREGELDFALVTAADMSGDGTRVVVRGYRAVRVWPLGADDGVVDALARPFLSAMSGSAAEAIAFEREGYGLYTVAEGSAATLFYLAWRP
jgi:hypothetical protein